MLCAVAVNLMLYLTNLRSSRVIHAKFSVNTNWIIYLGSPFFSNGTFQISVAILEMCLILNVWLGREISRIGNSSEPVKNK